MKDLEINKFIYYLIIVSTGWAEVFRPGGIRTKAGRYLPKNFGQLTSLFYNHIFKCCNFDLTEISNTIETRQTLIFYIKGIYGIDSVTVLLARLY